MNWRHRLRVLDVYPESPDTVSVYLTGHRRHGDAAPLSAASPRRLLGSLRGHDIYLCGPPGMTAPVRLALHELGVDIHEETFTF